MIGISLEPGVVLELIYPPDKADEFLPVYTFNANPLGGMDEPVRDPAHVEEKPVPVFVVLILAGDEGHHCHSAVLVESPTGNLARQPVNGSADDLD